MSNWLKALLVVLALLFGCLCCIALGLVSIPVVGAVIAANYTPGPTSTPAPTPTPMPVTYEYTHTLVFTNVGRVLITRLEVNESIPEDIPPYQTGVSWDVRPEKYKDLKRTDNGQAAVFEFKNLEPGEKVQVIHHGMVTVHPVSFELGNCRGDLPDTDIAPEEYIESDNPEIIQLAEKLAEGKSTACQKTRAFYDYVIENLKYLSTKEEKGALEALHSRVGDCVEFSDLFIALNRAVGIPARKVQGGVYSLDEDQKVKKDLGHQWAEVYMPGTGWVPMDPTWGQDAGMAERYFARLSPTHIQFLKNGDITQFTYWYDDEKGLIELSEEWKMEIVK